MTVSAWQLTVGVLLWGTLLLYGVASLWWLLQVTILSYGWEESARNEVPLDDVQVRVLTVDAAEIVQATVNTVPDAVGATHVIAETPMTVAGATTHVVPDEFDCAAQRKGRAIEWARRQLPCAETYVLYLDEDSLLTGFDGLPAGDVIQLTEHPLRTGSRLSYVSEIFRVGFQFEQRAFHRLAYPAYAWGGAVAVRHELEDRITWDVATITEDTTFVWRAAAETDLDYRLVDAKVRNQAPPTVWAMIQQRRRWISGTVADIGLLPRRYQAVVLTRIVTWGLSPLVPLVAIVGVASPGAVPVSSVYVAVSLALIGILFVFMITGLVEYRKYPEVWSAYLLATPVVVVLHSLGALWGVVQPARTFEVTEKSDTVSPETITERNPELPAEELLSDTGDSNPDDESGRNHPESEHRDQK